MFFNFEFSHYSTSGNESQSMRKKSNLIPKLMISKGT
ncbi:hypothetical protein LSS_21185 [Leptospira santarosai serovar Shermani str. LT 821]|uniref:Uncharacterized protein n=1 Tax=Leptospira santarosai serovar Shermani str. LT 821 TaxID=758847 RepID=A0A097ESD8_9LEPT|nr:hypothetical protein LSS_21185 [Leptospira santarosai serovar Shermani str. LT 821]